MPTNVNLGKISAPVNLIDYTTGNELTINSDGTSTIRLDDGSGNSISSQANGAQRALDVGIDVSGVQIDPRQIRTLTSSDIVTADQGNAPWSQNITQIAGNNIATAASGIAKIGLTDGSGTSITLGQKVIASSIPVAIASDQTVIPVTLGNITGKTNVLKTGSLVTTAITADQVILTYTVTAGKTFYLQSLTMYPTITVGNHSDVIFGNVSLEIVAGPKVITDRCVGPGVDPVRHHYEFSEPIPIVAATVVRVVTTPGSTISFTWIASFSGYER